VIVLAGALARVAVSRAEVRGEQEREADTLEKMARDNFGALTAAELKLVRSAPFRDLPWLGPDSNPDNPANDAADGAKWGPERTIRAQLLAWLYADPNANRYIDPSGLGFAAARIVGTFDLSYVKVTKPLTILRCYIADGVDLSHAELASVDFRRCVTGPVNADLSVVNGDIGFRYGTYGPVSFFRSHISGDFDCSGGHFSNSGRDAVSAIEATIDGDALFHDGFSTDGFVDFRLARIGRSLSFNDAHFTGNADNGLNAERARVTGTFYWVDIRHTALTQLDLENASADSIWDDEKSWPAAGNLMIDGFTYNHFSGGPWDAEHRLRWLNLQPVGYRPQPFRQLAKVLNDAGQEMGSTEVMIAKQDELRHYGNLSRAERIWNVMLEVTVGYGYRPLRALWWIIGFVIFGTILFGWGHRAMLVTPTQESAYETYVSTGAPPPHYPSFNAFVYSLENFMPVVDLSQGAYWRPNPRHTFSGRIRIKGREMNLGMMPAACLRWYLWIHIIAGWTLTPLLFAGLSGLIRSD